MPVGQNGGVSCSASLNLSRLGTPCSASTHPAWHTGIGQSPLVELRPQARIHNPT